MYVCIVSVDAPGATAKNTKRVRLQKMKVETLSDHDGFEANEHKYDSGNEQDAPTPSSRPVAGSDDEEEEETPEEGEGDQLEQPDSSMDADNNDDAEEEETAGGSEDDSDAPRNRRKGRQSPQTPTKNSAAAKAAREAVKQLRAKPAATQAAAAAAASSPVKKWIAPIGSSSFTSAAGKVSLTAKQYNVRVIVAGDMGSAMNGASRVSRKTLIVSNIDTGKPMVLVGYGDDASKYMVNLHYGDYYTLDLESKANTPGKELCLPDHTHYFKIASGTKVRPYVVDPTTKDDFDAMDNTERLCVSISTVVDCLPQDTVTVYGIVMKVFVQPMRNGSGLKVILADATACINVMFFEATANIVVGVSLVLVGARVWTNTRTQARELSVYNTTVVMTNQLRLAKPLIKMCRQQDYAKLVDVSAIPSEEPRTMRSLKEEAAGLANESDKVAGTVLLRLDASRPTNNGSINYNGCVKCKRKIKPIDEQDAAGNTYFDHDVDRGESHKALTYNSHFLFNGRFKEDDDDAFFIAQVDDTLGQAIFGVTSNVMSEMGEAEKTAVMNKATATSFKFNITMAKGGEITSMLMV